MNDTVAISRDAWDDMYGYIESLERKIEGLEREVNSLEREINDLEREINDLKCDIDDLEYQLMLADEYAAELEEKLNGAS